MKEETKAKLSAALKGRVIDGEWAQKCGSAMRGKHHTKETRARLSAILKGRKGGPLSAEHRRKLSIAQRRRFALNPISPEQRALMARGIANSWPRSPDVLKRMSEANKGAKNPYWKNGATPINKLVRQSKEFRLWREAVFQRDNWTCQDCGVRGTELHPHHKKAFATHPELRFDVDNGQTLCAPCHRKTDTWGNRGRMKKLLNGEL